jgi:hypothetical protein
MKKKHVVSVPLTWILAVVLLESRGGLETSGLPSLVHNIEPSYISVFMLGLLLLVALWFDACLVCW